jgi:hypothetical protein
VNPRSRVVLVGLAGALMLVVGSGAFLAMGSPPYQQDETSWVGYTLSLREGTLPSLDTPIPEHEGDEALQVRQTRPFTLPWIHVANNPPFTFLVALPFVNLTILMEIESGPLLVMRLLNVAGSALAVGLAFCLGRELSGGSRFAGLTTAGLLAGVIAIPVVSSVAGVDGVALGATTGVTWALARFARSCSLHDAFALGWWLAGAAAVRPMSLVFAGAAGAMALAVGFRRGDRRALVPLALRLGAPTILLVGWFYVVNLQRYGDFTGSRAIFEKLGRTGDGNVLGSLAGSESFFKPMTYVLSEIYGRNPWWEYEGLRQYLIPLLAVGIIVAALHLSRGRRKVEGALRPASSTAWLCCAGLVPVPVILTAQHIAGGGAGHARYLLPILPILAAAAAFVGIHLHRWVPVVLVGAYVISMLTRLRAARDLRAPADHAPEALSHDLVGEPFQTAAVAIALLGAFLLLVPLIRLAMDPATPPSQPAPATPNASRT